MRHQQRNGANKMQVGQKVTVSRNQESWLNKAVWWPAQDITGTVTRICKNGSVYVAVDQFQNNSKDGLKTRVFTKQDNVTIQNN